MKVILLDDVRKLGEEGDVVEVKDGYALNYLIPKKLAKQATPSALKEHAHFEKAQAAKFEQDKKAAEAKKEEMKEIKLVFPVKVGEEGKMFGSITSIAIAEELEKLGHPVEKKNVDLDNALTQVGEYTVDVKLFKGVYVPVSVVLEPENKEE